MSTVSISDLGPFIGKVAVDVFFFLGTTLKESLRIRRKARVGGRVARAPAQEKSNVHATGQETTISSSQECIGFPEKRLKLWSSKIANCQPVDRFFSRAGIHQKIVAESLGFSRFGS